MITVKRIEQLKRAAPHPHFEEVLCQGGGYVELIEILDLAIVGLKKRQQTRKSVYAHRDRVKGNRATLQSIKPVDAVGKEAPPAPAMPTGVPVAKGPPLHTIGERMGEPVLIPFHQIRPTPKPMPLSVSTVTPVDTNKLDTPN